MQLGITVRLFLLQKKKNANNKQWANTGFRSDEADVNMNELSTANGLIQIQKQYFKLTGINISNYRLVSNDQLISDVYYNDLS